MCGIVGYAVSHSKECPFDLIQATEKIKHRGPDDYGYWNSSDGKVGLGHRRLSILDLSENGHQPMFDNNREIVIVFNGEIYNFLEIKNLLISKGFSFYSSSDTEVLIYAYKYWGTDFVKYLNGMFAIAIYDHPKSTLILARDRVGEKPLFYSLQEHSIYFASELKALLVNNQLDKKLDIESFNEYLKVGYVTSDRCIISKVNKLLPGHFLMFNTKTGYVIKDRYWELPECNYKYESEDDLLNTLENLLRDSVNKQMVADVPVGVLLSGGIDSSIITALASNISRKVKTFTVGFPGYGTFDETKYAKIVSNYYNTEHIELKASNPDLEILMPKLAEQFDEPISDSSMIPTYLVSQLVREHCTVALGGDGGDELFGGYKDYNFYLSAEATFGKVPLFIRNSAKKIIENFVPLGFKGRNYLLQFCKDFQNFELVNLSLFDYQTRCKILSDFIGKSCSLKSYEGDRIHKSKNEKDLLQQLTRMDFLNYLPNNVLVKVDRSSMLSSLEVRAPFLDYRLIDFAFSSVPSVLKANKIDRKILLRKFSSKLMPADFDNRRKQGFSLPLDSLFREKKNNSFIKDVLFSKDCIIDKKLSGSLLNGLNYSRSNSDRIFNLVMFELWRKKYNINV